MTQRQSQILHTVASERRIEVGRLAEILGVSQVTIRKDLDVLEKQSLIKRQHGVAVLNAELDINNRLAIHYEQKHSIVTRAVTLINDGDVIMIESGSCCALLAEQIAQKRRNVTIITCSVHIANRLRQAESIQVRLLGGTVLMEPMVTVGPLTMQALDNFYVDKLFTGTDGITPNGAFTGKDIRQSEVIRKMAQHSKKTIVMTDSSKFRRQGTVILFPPEDVYAVYTDSACDPEIVQMFREHGVIVNMDDENATEQ